MVSRLEPRRAPEVINVLHVMEFAVSDESEVYHHAAALSRPEGVLVNADEQYYRRAVGAGQVTLLRDYR